MAGTSEAGHSSGTDSCVGPAGVPCDSTGAFGEWCLELVGASAVGDAAAGKLVEPRSVVAVGMLRTCELPDCKMAFTVYVR